MTLTVNVKDSEAKDLINAIKLLRGVESVTSMDSLILDKNDIKMWKKARKDLDNGKALDIETVKSELGL